MASRGNTACDVPHFEPLEARWLLSLAFPAAKALLPAARYPMQGVLARAAAAKEPRAKPIAIVQNVSPSATLPPADALTPTSIRSAYGLNQVMFGSVQGDGAGQTIAIIDAYDYPTAWADLQAFDAQFGLSDPPSFRRVAQDGSTNYPPTDPAGAGNPKGTWELEAALDIQWAHSMAPGANIILVEATDNSFTNLVVNAVDWARSQPGVVAISMSFSAGEFAGETTYDSYFTTPANHGGVTFLAATGDAGAPGGYPAYSPNVVAVGGTTLTLSGSSYISESGWSGSGGGISTVQPQPQWQRSVVPQSTTMRTAPDVSFVGDPSTGVAVYDSWDYPASPWLTVGGTSLSTPMWAGIVAVADQGRQTAGLGPLDGPTQTLPGLYQLPLSDFHDIASGSNGYQSVGGYDLVTGRGTPRAQTLIYDLAGIGAIDGAVFVDADGDGARDAGEQGYGGVTVWVDANNNAAIDPASTTSFVASAVPATIPDNNAAGLVSTLTVAGVASAIADVDVTFSITHSRDSDLTAYLSGPDGTQVKLFAGVGGSANNFSNTTLSDQATTSIAAGTAPFAGTLRPSEQLLAAFNGKSANGAWSLKVVDSRNRATGSLTAWSLKIATAAERTAVTGGDGSYGFDDVWAGTYTIRQQLPATYVQTGPAPGGSPPPGRSAAVTTAASGQDFGIFPTVFAADAPGQSYYVSLDSAGSGVDIYQTLTPQPPPAWHVALALLPSMTFQLSGSGNSVYVDFANGSPIPAGNIAVDASLATDPTLAIVGPPGGGAFVLTDTQIGPAGGGSVLYQGLGTLRLRNCIVSYSGSLETVDLLYLDAGTRFYWS
jgi:subtilisin-like proprotein convertase family protein